MRAALVVVPRPDGGGVGQGEQHLRQAAIQGLGAAGLKVGATAAVDQQGIAGKDMVAPQKAHAACGVAGRVQGGDLFLAEAQNIAMLKLHGGGVDAASTGGCSAGADQFRQLTGAGDVIGMGMGLHRPEQLQPMLAQHGQVALDLLVHRVDDERLPRGFVKQQVGVGAGAGVEQLQGVHLVFLVWLVIEINYAAD